MAIYKVLQDVEAEDTLIGPLTLRQCIYAAIAALAAYASFVAIAEGAAYLVAFFLPIIAFGAFFAFPWSGQQPTEVWALAKIRYFLKPRRRIWDQSGAQELVSITAPKKVERVLTNGLSQMEVKSRLQALADTIDTRGWAVKNVGVNMYYQQGIGPYDNSDRLVAASSLPQEVPNYDTTAVVDVLDTDTNPLAHHLDQMMDASSAAQRQRIEQQINQPQTAQTAGNGQSAGDNYWFINNQTSDTPPKTTVTEASDIETHASKDTSAKESKSRSNRSSKAASRPRTNRLAANRAPAQQSNHKNKTSDETPGMSLPPVTTSLKPATIELANNNDLSVAAMAHEAKRRNSDSSEEVIVSLH